MLRVGNLPRSKFQDTTTTGSEEREEEGGTWSSDGPIADQTRCGAGLNSGPSSERGEVSFHTWFTSELQDLAVLLMVYKASPRRAAGGEPGGRWFGWGPAVVCQVVQIEPDLVVTPDRRNALFARFVVVRADRDAA